MSIRIKHRVWVNTARDTDMKDLVYGPQESERLVQTDAFDQWDGASFNIADAANVDLNLDGITNVKGVYLQVNGDVEVTINGAATPIVLQRESSATGQVAKLFLEATITSINVANATGAAVAGHFHAWGKST